MSVALVASRPKEKEGWREGKPIEDPEKVKRWGFVNAKPSEYLIHVRHGKVSPSSGQGGSCFKWPADSVALVPTSLQRLSFVADQVTSEKVGVEVRGLAVYRIAEPLLAFRVLNFSYPERAQEKLESTLTAMFVGATRRIVANLAIEECLRKRKGALAEELLREVAPIIGGDGRADDVTVQGWGVVIDTIEIQEVKILSEAVFLAMQAPYRARLEKEAKEARALADLAIAEREAECRRASELAQIQAEAELHQRRTELEKKKAEMDAERAAQRAALRMREAERELADAQQLAERKIAQQAALDERKAEVERRRAQSEAEHAVLEQRLLLDRAQSEAERAIAEKRLEADRAQAEREALPAQRALLELRLALAALEAEAGREARRAEAELARLEGLHRAEVETRAAEAAELRTSREAQLVVARNLPALAQALGDQVGSVHITQVGGGEHPFEALAGAMTALIGLARRVSGGLPTREPERAPEKR